MSEAVAALVDAGLSAERAAELAEAGLVVQVGGRFLVVAEDVDPLSGDRRALVVGDCAAVLAEPGTLRELRDAVADRHPGAARIVLRLDGPTRPDPDLGAELLLRYVQSGPPPAPPDDPSWTARPYESGDREPVAALLRAAIADGYDTVGSGAPDAAAAAFAEDLLDRVGHDVVVFCAVEDGRFAGHATIVWDEDELTGAVRPELFDMFVLPERRGTPAARLLTAAAVGWAAAAGSPLRGHVVGGDAAATAVFERLVAAGWRPAEAYWALPMQRHDERRTDAEGHG